MSYRRSGHRRGPRLFRPLSPSQHHWQQAASAPWRLDPLPACLLTAARRECCWPSVEAEEWRCWAFRSEGSAMGEGPGWGRVPGPLAPC